MRLARRGITARGGCLVDWRYAPEVQTRYLILASLITGLVILLAGVVWFGWI